MIDIQTAKDGEDFVMADTQAPKATNILQVQLGDLEYAKDLGIDLKYFLTDKFKFQNESFAAYLVETLANRGVNVANVDTSVQTLFRTLNIAVSPDETSTALVAG